MSNLQYPRDCLLSLYELGRLYFEMGYDEPAERMFSGVAQVSGGETPALLGLALIRIERNQYEEAASLLQAAVESGAFVLEAKMALAVIAISGGNYARAKQILVDVAEELERLGGEVSPAVRGLWDSLALRTDLAG